MYYVMSDIHGEYDKFLKMLELIDFKNEDTLFIVGDSIDRGLKSVDLLMDLSNRFNVYPTLGNHELMALSILKRLYTEINENTLSLLDEALIEEYMNWLNNGGQATLDGFKKISKEQALDLIDYMSDFSLYETIDINGKTYVMVHAGINHFDENKALDEYSVDDFCFDLIDYNKQYYSDPNIYIITGHYPTFATTNKAEIFIKNNHIAIDCGACYENGKLACLCLDTYQVFYV